MKQIKFLSALFILFSAVTFTSCDNEPIDPFLNLDDFGGGGVPTGGAFTAKVDGVDFNANELIEADYTSTAFGTQLNIIGATSNGKIMNIQILNPTVGTRTASDNIETLLTFSYFASVNDQYSSINVSTGDYNGTITITEFNVSTNKVSGTFSFIGYGTTSSTAQVEVTTGVFNNITFQNDVTTTPPAGIVGSYLLTAFNTSVPTDLNGDGTSSTNQLNETTCLNNSFLTINANNTFSTDSKGLEIIVGSGGGVDEVACFEDALITGTWSLTGNQITFTYTDEGEVYNDTFTVNGNTLTFTIEDGDIVGYAGGAPAYLTSDITFIFTKQ